ncbi:class I SAM-dependent methyltransferase [Haloparvum sp. AD34]
MTDDPANAVDAFYSRYAALYDRVATDAPFAAGLREALAAAVGLERGDVVVELGCGTGANFPVLRERVGREGAVVGVDVSSGVLRRARDRVDREGWENVHVVRGDATEPPFAPAELPRAAGPAGEVDVVVGTFVTGMFAEPAGVVDDWCSIVGEGGRIGLLDLARSTDTGGRALNLVFRVLVRAGAPPGTKTRHGSPVRVLDERVRDAHAQIHERCACAATSRRLAGFARITTGRVAGESAGDRL